MATTWKTHQNIPRNNFLLKSAKKQFTQYGGHFEKKLQLRKFFSDSTIMFTSSIYPKISFFIEIIQSRYFRNMAAILKKKMVARNKIWIVSSCSPRQITPRYQFSLKSDKDDIVRNMAAILKKNGGSGNNFNSTITFATSHTTCSS